MADNTKMLQAILDKVNSLDQKIDGVDNKIDEVKEEVKKTRDELTERIDSLGLDLAELSDDAPTNEEIDELVKRVSKLEQKVFKN